MLTVKTFRLADGVTVSALIGVCWQVSFTGTCLFSADDIGTDESYADCEKDERQ
jgi:hypothetical protein